MVKRLTVLQFGRVQVGTITQERDGALTVKGETPELEQALRALIASIAVGPLTYHSGRKVESAQGIKHITVERTVRPTDADYLNALADALFNHRLLGKRVRGVLEQSTDSKVGNPASTSA